MNRRLLVPPFTSFLAGLSLASLATPSGATTTFQRIARVEDVDLAQAVAEPRMYAFDLSPSGRTLALLVTSGNSLQPARWILLIDARSGHVLRRCQTWRSAAAPVSEHYYPPQVLFTPDERFLVVREQEQVKTVDLATLRTVRTLAARDGEARVPISICRSSRSSLFAITFGTGTRTAEYEKASVHVEVIDVSDGSRRGSWEADDIPQTLSPDGTLAALSDWNVGGTLLRLRVVNSNSGRTVAVLDGGFRFNKRDPGRIGGRITGRFVSDDEILLSPDGGWDRSGRYAGGCLRIVHVPDGTVLRELRRDDGNPFGPTGDATISDDGQTVVAVSWYLPPRFYTHPHEAPPIGSGPELLVFLKNREFRSSAIVRPSGAGGRIGGAVLPLGLASDGSVIAVEENFGITVFGLVGP